MSIKVPQTNGLPPGGTYLAKLVKVKDLGKQNGPYGEKDQMLFTVEIAQGNEKHEIRDWVTKTWHPDSKLTEYGEALFADTLNKDDDLESWTGRQLRVKVAPNQGGNFLRVMARYPLTDREQR